MHTFMQNYILCTISIKKGVKRIMILGVDVGNFSTKSSKGIIFESKCTHTKGLNNLDCLCIDDDTIYLGEGEGDNTYRKINKGNYLKLLYGSIALSTNIDDIELAVGLPISQYNNDKTTLINLILNNNNKKIKINGISRCIRINDVEVFPEGAATVSDDFEGLVLDIGGRTTDCCLIEHYNNSKKIINPISIPRGTLNLYSDFINLLNAEFSLDLVDRDAERILRNGLKIDGQYINISRCKDVFYDFVNSLINKLNVEYSLKTYDVILTGGGAQILFNPLHSKIKNAILHEDYLFANANAFEELGRSIFE